MKQTLKLYYRLGRYEEIMEAYGDMLTYIKSKVTRNYTEKFINRSMDYIPETAVCINSNHPFHIKYLQDEKASEEK